MDFYFFNLVNQFAGKWNLLDKLGIFFASYFEYFLIFLVFVIFARKWRMVLSIFSAAILARFGIVELIRFVFPRARPFVENSVNLLISHETSSSFPSGHAAFYFALAFAICLYNKKIGLWFLLAAFLISFSRVFVGVHWLSDILAGALVGIFAGWLVAFFSRRFSAS